MPGSHKTSISLDADLMAQAVHRAHALGFGNSFSAYIAKLIRDDIAERGALSETPTTYKSRRAIPAPRRKTGARASPE